MTWYLFVLLVCLSWHHLVEKLYINSRRFCDKNVAMVLLALTSRIILRISLISQLSSPRISRNDWIFLFWRFKASIYCLPESSPSMSKSAIVMLVISINGNKSSSVCLKGNYNCHMCKISHFYRHSVKTCNMLCYTLSTVGRTSNASLCHDTIPYHNERNIPTILWFQLRHNTG